MAGVLRRSGHSLFYFLSYCDSIEPPMITLEPPSAIALPTADPWRTLGLSASGLSRFLASARRRVGLRGEVEVLLTDDAALKQLNRQFRRKNKPTDVLSFPSPPELARHHAGDLAISLETAQRQADEHGHTLAVEVRVLLLHGLLHLDGMDHETDSGEMAEREAALRRELRLPHGLIARTVAPRRGGRA